MQQRMKSCLSSRHTPHDDLTDFDRTTSLPSLAEQLELSGVYFRHCHNQPYCYFHERSFYRRLRDNTLPPFLILAVLATAARFTASVPGSHTESPEEGRADVWAQCSWAIISRFTMSSGFCVCLRLVQATNLLAVIDFTSEFSSIEIEFDSRENVLTSNCSRRTGPPGLVENRPCNPFRTGNAYDV